MHRFVVQEANSIAGSSATVGRAVFEDQEASRARAAAYSHDNVVVLVATSTKTASQSENERLENLRAFLEGISSTLTAAPAVPSESSAEQAVKKRCEELLSGIGAHLN